MRLYTISGILKTKKISHLRIDWNKKSRSKFQTEVKEILREFWSKHIVYEEFPVFGTRLSIDFFNATKNLAIEVQGQQHTKFNSFFHSKGRSDFLNQLKNDEETRKFCKINDIKLIEIFWEDKKILDRDFVKSLILV